MFDSKEGAKHIGTTVKHPPRTDRPTQEWEMVKARLKQRFKNIHVSGGKTPTLAVGAQTFNDQTHTVHTLCVKSK